MGNCCTSGGGEEHARPQGNKISGWAHESRYSKLGEAGSCQSSPATKRITKENTSGDLKRPNSSNNPHKVPGVTLLDIAKEKEDNTLPVKQVEENETDSAEKVSADPAAISRWQAIPSDEKAWLVENVTEGDYRKNEEEHRQGEGSVDIGLNRHHAIRRDASSPLRKERSLPSQQLSELKPPDHVISDEDVSHQSRKVEWEGQSSEVKVTGVDATSPEGGIPTIPPPPTSSARHTQKEDSLLGDLTLSSNTHNTSPAITTDISTSPSHEQRHPSPFSTTEESTVSLSGQHTPSQHTTFPSDDSPVVTSALPKVCTPVREDRFSPERVSTPVRQNDSLLSVNLNADPHMSTSAEFDQSQSLSDMAIGPGQVVPSGTTRGQHIGDILLRLVDKKGSLQIQVCEGRSFACFEQRSSSSEIYVKCYMESKDGKHTKERTSAITAVENPKFNQALNFKSSWRGKQLKIMVWADHRLGRNICLGHAIVDLATLSLPHGEEGWFSLFTGDQHSMTSADSFSSISSFSSMTSRGRKSPRLGKRSKR